MAETTPNAAPGVTVEIRVRGRSVPGFPFQQFTRMVELPPAAARELVETFLRLVQESANGEGN